MVTLFNFARNAGPKIFSTKVLTAIIIFGLSGLGAALVAKSLLEADVRDDSIKSDSAPVAGRICTIWECEILMSQLQD